MIEAPAPLTPADCNLRGFQWMPIDVVRLLDSDLFLIATGDEFKAALALWCKSWSQVPAASLPADERLLAGLSGAGAKWKKVRDVAMRGWVMCSDGRWYHPVVAEKALEAQVIAKHHADQKAAAADRKALERADRQRMFALLREHGVVPDFHTSTTKLRELVAALKPSPDPANVTRDASHDATAKTGQDKTEPNQTEPNQTSFDSAPIGAGGTPPEPPPAGTPSAPSRPPATKVKTEAEQEQSRLWAALKVALVEQKTCENVKDAGVLLGKHAAKYGKDVFIEAARQAVHNKPVDLLTYLVGLCETAAGKRQRLGGVGQLTDAARQAANDESDAEALRILSGNRTPGQEGISHG